MFTEIPFQLLLIAMVTSLGPDGGLATVASPGQLGFPEGYIINGLDAAPGNFPSNVWVGGTIDCGGSLVGPIWVLTAAHCALKPVGDYLIIAGVTSRSEIQTNWQRSTVDEIFMHPAYDPVTFSSDVALLRLTSPMEETPYVKFMPFLWTAEPPASGLVAGWGNTIEGDPLSSPDNLKYVWLQNVDDATCQSAYAQFIPDLEVCYSYPGVGTCQGDSGGPLYAHQQMEVDGVMTGMFYQYGIDSYAAGCGRPDFPTVFVRFPAFYNWMEATIASN